jgi:hypothetical protein
MTILLQSKNWIFAAVFPQTLLELVGFLHSLDYLDNERLDWLVLPLFLSLLNHTKFDFALPGFSLSTTPRPWQW